MKIAKDLKKVYKGLSWYNRQKLIEANRPFGKRKKKPKTK